MNCALRHIGCNSIHVSDELQSNSASKSWRSQFMMRQHQFIHKNEQSKNRRRFILLLLLFSACNKGLGLAQVHLTGQMRCSHLVELSNSPLRTSPLACFLFYQQLFSSNGSFSCVRGREMTSAGATSAFSSCGCSACSSGMSARAAEFSAAMTFSVCLGRNPM